MKMVLLNGNAGKEKDLQRIFLFIKYKILQDSSLRDYTGKIFNRKFKFRNG